MSEYTEMESVKTEWNTSFTDFPPEVRNLIYQNRLTVRTQTGESKAMTVKEFQLRFLMLRPLLYANKQVMSEALPVLFGSNVLHISASPISTTEQEFLEARISGQRHIKYASNIYQGRGYSFNFEVPPRSLRPLFKRLKITLFAPTLQDVARIWPDFVQKLPDFGFTRSFEWLLIELLHNRFLSPEEEAVFKAKAIERLRRLAITKRLAVTFREESW